MPHQGKGVYCTYDRTKLAEAVAACRSGISLRRAAQCFNIPKLTLGDRIAGKIPIDAAPGKKTIIPKETEHKIANMAIDAANSGFGLTRLGIMKKAGEICRKVGVKTPFRQNIPGKDWWAGFKKRHPEVTLRKPESLSSLRSRAGNPVTVGKYYMELNKILKDNGLEGRPHLIWNCDETGVCLEHTPVKVVARQGTRNVPGRTGNSRESVTIMACISASGDHMPPMIIVKRKTQRSLALIKTNEGPEGSCWTYQKNAWMEDALGLDWFQKVFLERCGPERPQLLLLDSHHSHETLSLLEEARKNGIIMMAFPPHSTHLLCPLDKTVFGPFQRAFNRISSEYMSASLENTVNKSSIAHLIKSAYQESFNRANIVSGFESTGIFCFNPQAIPASAFLPSAQSDTDQDSLISDNIFQERRSTPFVMGCAGPGESNDST